MSRGSPKMLRTASREYVTHPMAVQMRPASATAPVRPNRLELDDAISVRSSVEMMPSSPMRPGAYVLSRVTKALSVCTSAVSQSPATANTTYTAAKIANSAW